MPPLEAVDWAEIPFLTVLQTEVVQKLSGGISVPDFDLFVTEELCISFAVNEPHKLFGDTSPKYILGRQDWEALAKVVSHLMAEFGVDTGSRSIILVFTSLNDILDHFKVLELLMLRVLFHEF